MVILFPAFQLIFTHMKSTLNQDELLVREFVKRLAPFTEKDWSEFWSRMEPAEFKKHQFLLKSGEVESYLNFLVSGISRLFYTKAKKEFTIRLIFPGTFFNSYSSFLNHQPSGYSVEAITDIRLYRMSFEQLEDLSRASNVAPAIAHRALEHFYMLKEKREISLLSNTAEENYRELLQEQPELINQIPQKYLASYLGITPQSLSRILRTFNPEG